MAINPRSSRSMGAIVCLHSEEGRMRVNVFRVGLGQDGTMARWRNQ